MNRKTLEALVSVPVMAALLIVIATANANSQTGVVKRKAEVTAPVDAGQKQASPRQREAKGDVDQPIILGSINNEIDNSFATQLEFAGHEPYDVNGSKGTRYKLSVRNRSDHPDFLWLPSGKPCGTNKNAARTWVEVFGSPGDKRLAGFCGLRSSEDLGNLWFPVPSGEKGPQCVYIVMTDQKSGKRYESNRTCSRSFTVVRGRLKSDSQHPAPFEEWIHLENAQAGAGWKPVMIRKEIDLNTPASQLPQVMKPDLLIKQFLFPPTNDKALRVRVVNTGAGPSTACRLVLTVRKINGVAAGRKTHVNVPPLAAGASDWLHIDVKILPNNISLQSTTFKLNIDATGLIAESDESNNEVWHNL